MPGPLRVKTNHLDVRFRELLISLGEKPLDVAEMTRAFESSHISF
jgi:hypothetical protein